MANPTSQWDLVPVYGVYKTFPGEAPISGRVEFKLSQRVSRVDGRAIYPDGAVVSVTIGKPEDQDATVRAAVRTAWRAFDQANDPSFDGAAWDIWWDTKILPAAIFTAFPAADDPDITQGATPYTVTVREALTSGSGKQYNIQPLLAHLEHPIPGINLRDIEVPPGSPSVPAPVYAKGIAGGIAALDLEGDVINAAGEKVTGGLSGPVPVSQLQATGTASGTTFLRGDGSWATPPDTNTTYNALTQAQATSTSSTVGGLATGQRIAQAIDANPTVAGKVTGLNGAASLWKGTEAEYNALTPVEGVVYITV